MLPVGKAFLAFSALIRLLSSMSSDMYSEGIRLSESLQTDSTGERLLSRVLTQMDSEVARLSEGSWAVWTLERSVPAMDSHVNLQSRGSQKRLSADFTNQFLALVLFSLVGRPSQWYCRHLGKHTADILEHRGIVIEVISSQ